MEKEKGELTFLERFLIIFGIVLLVVIPHILFGEIAFGQELREPPTIEYAKAQHEISEGDTLWKIAGMYKIELDALIHANPQIDNPNEIYPKERINIPNNLDAWNEKDNSGYESKY